MAETRTLSQKLENLHAAEDSVRAALTDLVDSGTGEAIAPGEFIFDATSRSVFTNEGGRCVRKRAQILPTPKGAS